MDEFIISAVIQAISLYAAYKFGQHVMAMRITRMLIDRDPNLERQIEMARKELARLENKETKPDAKFEPIEVERHGDQLYLFQKDSREFLAQGSSLDEALDRIKDRFPDRNFKGLLSKDQADDLGINSK